MAELQKIRRVLIANRGEIAVRVVRACRQLGVESVVVVSEADRNGPAAQLADFVVEIGPAPAAQSYLDMDRVLEAARTSGADAIHPGYGFLAENAGFAARVVEAGLVFVGPPAAVIEEMGIKTAARTRMQAAGVPVVPGAELPADADAATWQRTADEVGYPLLVKAAAGGGGKGMREVGAATQLGAAVEASRREALTAFGDDRVYMERRLIRPRHVEVQILADNFGHVVHLGERDCSLQRRHQKVVEEAPAPGLDAATRERMHEAAVQAARSVDYRGAGTVEMLLDASGEFFFLEMNTRLQVEHPVTELVWGIDLVEQQLRVADGQPLGFKQEDLRPTGHAMEVRLYAEDPATGFLPQTGTIGVFAAPHGPGWRVDSGVVSGSVVSLHYDPMLAKLCAAGGTRDEARRRLIELLRNTVLLGVQTNQEYLIEVLGQEAFAAGQVHTAFLEQHLPAFARSAESDEVLLAAAAALYMAGRPAALGSGDVAGPPPVWSELGPWRLGQEQV